MPTDSVLESIMPAPGFSPARRWRCLLIAGGMAGLLFYLGSQPFAVGLIPEPWDKLAHLVVFSVITGLLWIGTGGHLALVVIGFVAGIGALDEWHQSTLPGRSADYLDFLSDVLAAMLTVFVLRGWRK